jgi:hypothetical protein
MEKRDLAHLSPFEASARDRRFAASGVGVECRVVRDFSAAEVVTRFASAMVVEPLDGGRADIVTT